MKDNMLSWILEAISRCNRRTLSIASATIILMIVTIIGCAEMRERRLRETCRGNLEKIYSAKMSYSVWYACANGEEIATNEVCELLLGNRLPSCPSSGTYTIGRIYEYPTCSYHEELDRNNGRRVHVDLVRCGEIEKTLNSVHSDSWQEIGVQQRHCTINVIPMTNGGMEISFRPGAWGDEKMMSYEGVLAVLNVSVSNASSGVVFARIPPSLNVGDVIKAFLIDGLCVGTNVPMEIRRFERTRGHPSKSRSQ